jgi:hypothetical protein
LKGLWGQKNKWGKHYKGFKKVFKVLKISNIEFCSLSLTNFSIEFNLVGCEKHSQTLYENNLESLFCLYNQIFSFIFFTFKIPMVDPKNWKKIDKQSFSKLHCIVERITNYRRIHLFIFYVSMKHLTTNYFEKKTIWYSSWNFFGSYPSKKMVCGSTL